MWSTTWSAPTTDSVAAAAKSLQSCPTLCDPIDRSPPGSPVPGILQARTLEWVAISFFNAWKWKVKMKSLSRVQPSATPWTAAFQAPPPMGFSRQESWSGEPLSSPDWLCMWVILAICSLFKWWALQPFLLISRNYFWQTWRWPQSPGWEQLALSSWWWWDMETGDNEVPQIGSCLVFIEGSIFSRFCTYHMKNKAKTKPKPISLLIEVQTTFVWNRISSFIFKLKINVKYFKYVENNKTDIHESSIQFLKLLMLCYACFRSLIYKKTQNLKDTIKQKYNTKNKIQY